MASSQGPNTLNGSDIFYRRIVLDMMAASQYQHDRNRMPHTTSTIVKADTMDNAHRTSSTQQHHGRNSWRPSCHLGTDTEDAQPQVDCIDREYQLPQTKHPAGAHHLFKDNELRAPPNSTTQLANLDSISLNEALDCMSSSGIHRWTSECRDNASIHPEEFIIDQKPRFGQGINPSQVEANLSYSVPPYLGGLVKEDVSFIDITKSPKQEHTDELGTNFPSSGIPMASDSFGGLPGDIHHTTKSIQDFGCDWPAPSSMEMLNSAPSFDNTIMQSTAALRNIEGCWWGDGNHLLAANGWPDMNDGLTNLMMTQRDLSHDSVENGKRFPSPYDSQCSPVSSFTSNRFTPETVTLAPRELESSGRDGRDVLPESLRLNGSQQPTMPSLDHTREGYMQVDKSANLRSQADERCRGSQRRERCKLAPQRSRAKDAFLVRSKRAGMSYKEIKEKGHFAEAESTLRGRFRALTKRKEHRVRKPEWETKDVSSIAFASQWTALANFILRLQLQLLREAVRRYTQSIESTQTKYEPHQGESPSDANPKCPRVPWKLVGEYIWNNGGSYHFGNATCKKKWGKLQDGEDLR